MRVVGTVVADAVTAQRRLPRHALGRATPIPTAEGVVESFRGRGPGETPRSGAFRAKEVVQVAHVSFRSAPMEVTVKLAAFADRCAAIDAAMATNDDVAVIVRMAERTDGGWPGNDG